MIQINAAARLKVMATSPDAIAKDMAKFAKKETNATFLQCIKWLSKPTLAKKYAGKAPSTEEYAELMRANKRKVPNAEWFLKQYDAGKPAAVEGMRLGALLLTNPAAILKSLSKAMDAARKGPSADELQGELDKVLKKKEAALKKWGLKPDYEGSFSEDQLKVMDPLFDKEQELRKKIQKAK